MEPTTAPIRVAHLLYTMAYGGVETVIINWFLAAPKESLELSLIVFRVPGELEMPFVKKAEEAGLKIQFIPWSRRKPIFRSARELCKILKENRIQILHTHNTYAEMVGLVAGKRLGLKLVSTQYVWISKEEAGLKRFLLLKLSAWFLPKYDLLTAQCEKTIRDSAQWGLDSSKIKLLPSGYDVPPPCNLSPEDRSRLRAEKGATAETIVVCNVARLYPEKGHERLLRLWPRILERCPHARLWIYGVGPLEDELKQLWRELHLEETVRFEGFTGDLAKELELCDVQIHPSFNEGIPIAICAGMASALPIVATAVGGLPEVIYSGENGILVNVDDEDGLVEETVRLILDAKERNRLGQAAQRFIKEEYSLEAAARILKETYQQLVG